MFGIEKKDQEIINKIAAEFPYCIIDVAMVYFDSGCSEDNTKDILTKRLIRGH